MLNLDARDFAWWTRKAKIENLRRRLLAMNSMRFAMHGDESYDRMEQNMIDQIELWEQPKQSDQEVLANWKVRVKELEAAFKRTRRKK